MSLLSVELEVLVVCLGLFSGDLSYTYYSQIQRANGFSFMSDYFAV